MWGFSCWVVGSVPCVVAQHLGPNEGCPLAWRSFASLMAFVLPVSMPWRRHLGPGVLPRFAHLHQEVFTRSVPEIALDHDRVVVPVRGTPPAESSWRGNAPGRGRSLCGTNARGKGAPGATVSRRLQRRLKPSPLDGTSTRQTCCSQQQARRAALERPPQREVGGST